MRPTSFPLLALALAASCTSENPLDDPSSGEDSSTSAAPGGSSDASPTSTTPSSESGEIPSETGGTTADTTGDGTETVDDTGPEPRCASDDDCGGDAPFCLDGACVACWDLPSPGDACEAADPDAPFCAGGTCVSCSDENAEATCAAANPELPACLDEQCVQCSDANASLCDGATPACVSGECAPCSFHSQCPASACNLWTGECLDATPQTIGPDGAHDFATLTAAFAAVPAGGQGVFILHENPGNAAYAESVQLAGDRVIALLGAAGTRPLVRGADNDPDQGIRVDDGATLLIENLRFSGFHPVNNLAHHPLNITNARLALDRTEVVDNRGAIRLTAGSEGRLRNTAVGVSTNGTPAVRVFSSTLDAVYSTFVAENANSGTGANVPAGIVCGGLAAVNVRNSIVSNVSGATTSIAGCAGVISVSYSATREAVAGMGNQVVGALDTDWFNSWPGDLRLSNAGANVFADIGQWQAGDPPTDLDDSLRPTVDGTADYVGAQRP